MFKGLFKSGWKSDALEKRLAFIADVDVANSEDQNILETLAKTDAEASVRHAAMAKMTNLQALYALSQPKDGVEPNESQQYAASIARQLMQSDALTESDIQQFLAKHPKADLLVAKFCPYPEIRTQILQKLDESQQADVIAEVAYSNTRVMLAENIQQLDCLETARKHLKGKDKTAEKLIKGKIDTLRAEQKQQTENAAQVRSIREQMEGLARYVAWSEEIKTKFFTLSQTWDTLAFEPEADEKALYDKAFVQVEADVKHHIAIALANQNQAKISNSLESQCSEIASFSLTQLIESKTEISNKLHALQTEWDKETGVMPPNENTRDRVLKANKAIASVLAMAESASNFHAAKSTVTDTDEQKQERLLALSHHAKTLLKTSKALDWSHDYSQLLSKQEALAEANEILKASKDSQKSAKEALDNLHKKISRLFGIAKRGEIARAKRELASVNKAASQFDGNERKKLDERIAEAVENLEKIADWKDFAIEPKLIELCEKMEALPELEKQSKNPSANNLAKKIKALQDQWKSMGSSDVSDTHWPRFKAAGDIAYEPCAEFFKQRREIQKANLGKREPFVEQMKELFESTDWDGKLNYKAVEDKVSQIMQGWKKIKDVEHKPGQKQWDKLSAYKDQINEKLGLEYDKNIKEKYALTEQLEQMLAQEVNEQTLDKLKFIQSKWKQIGVTRRKQDQSAWLKFKAASDTVFEKIQGIRQEKRAVEDQQIDAYKNIHKQIHQLAKNTQDLHVSDKEFEALEEQYKALPELPNHLPEKLIERLAKDYRQACDAYAGAKTRISQAKLDKELDVLAEKASLCAELEQLAEDADANAVSELEAKINSLEITNKDYNKRFAKRLKQARKSDRDAFSEARRLLLIDFEIMLDKETPKEDKDLRLSIQLERMKSQGIGQAAVNATTQLENMKLDWLCMPGAEPTLQKSFDKRFEGLFS